MTDARLRSLQRRWLETHEPNDEAALLRERVRVSDLTHERLELAAYLGHPAALLAIGGPKDTWPSPTDFQAWLRGLHAWRGSVVLLAYMAAFGLMPGHDDPLYLEIEAETRVWLEGGAQAECPARAWIGRPVPRDKRPGSHDAHVLVKTLSLMSLEYMEKLPMERIRLYARQGDPGLFETFGWHQTLLELERSAPGSIVKGIRDGLLPWVLAWAARHTL